MTNQKLKRFFAVSVVTFFAIIFHANTAFGQHPCDNFPVTACVVPGSFQVWQISDNTTTATAQTGEPRIIADSPTPINSLWYQWTAPISANYILDTRGTNPNGATNFDTMIGLYTGGSTFASLTQLRANDDWINPTGCQSTVPLGTEWAGSSCVRFTSVAGTTYYFQVEGFSSQVGAFFLNLSLAPTSAEVSVSGKVSDAKGNPLSRVRVNLTKPGGEIVSVVTNSFGFYYFEGLDAGQTYVLQAQSKKYQFQNNPRVINIIDHVQNEDFIAESEAFFQRE